MTLVCFAVKEEARPFARLAASRPQVGILITGMGRCNAERAIRAGLAKGQPKLVLTCGFAGGLNPELRPGTVVFDASGEGGLESVLLATGARRGRFHCAGEAACTAAEKRALWESTGADAVEMESQFIRGVCGEHQVPSATVRVILDAVGEDLPLDFKRLLTPEQKLSARKLVLALVKAPGKISALLRFHKQTRRAAEKLAAVLSGCV